MDNVVAWRVGEFWSSANPDKKVLCLAQGDEMVQWAKRSDFIRWVEPIEAIAYGWTPEQIDETASRNGLYRAMTPDDATCKSMVLRFVSELVAPAPTQAQARATPASQDGAEELTNTVVRVLEGYADNYDMMARIGKTGDVDCRSVAHDIRRNIVDGVRAAILVARGAK